MERESVDDELLYKAAITAAIETLWAVKPGSVINGVRRRCGWKKPFYQGRSNYGAYSPLMAEVRKSDTGRCLSFNTKLHHLHWTIP